MTIEQILEIIERYKLRIPPTVYYDLLADVQEVEEEQEPFINKPCVSSGVCEHDKNKVLDKIRAEIDNALSDGMIHKKTVLGIIDKHKAETEAE